MGCARCHDHKYDPIAQKDFYRLFAYFNQVPNEKGFVWNYGNEEPLVKAPLPEQSRKLAELDAQAQEPSLWNDPAAAQKTMREQSRLRDEVNRWRQTA